MRSALVIQIFDKRRRGIKHTALVSRNRASGKTFQL